MWNRIFLALTGLATLVIAFFTYYAYSWLGSVAEPRSVIANYEFFAGLATLIVWVSAVVLLVIGNVILWTSKSAWALWSTFLFFAVFTLVHNFWLAPAGVVYRKENDLWDGGFQYSYIVGAVLVILFGAIVLGNQFVSVRLNRKMYGTDEEMQVERETQATVTEE